MISRYRLKKDWQKWITGTELIETPCTALFISQRIFVIGEGENSLVVGEKFINANSDIFELVDEIPKPEYRMYVNVGDIFIHKETGKEFTASSVNYYEGDGMKVTIKPVK